MKRRSRQSSNPDDFALKVKGGISSATTSDWDELSETAKQGCTAESTRQQS